MRGVVKTVKPASVLALPLPPGSGGPWYPIDEMKTLLPHEWPCGLVRKTQCLVEQKGSVNVNHLHCGWQNNGSKDVHALTPETCE